MTPEEKITALEKKIEELEQHIELQWRQHLERQKEIEELQKQQHKEVLDKQEQGFFKQKMIGLGAFLGILITVIGAFITVVKKLGKAKEEIKILLNK